MGKKGGADVDFARSDPASLWASRQLGIKNLDSSNDVAAIQRYLRSNETPWDKATRLANERSADLLNQLKVTQQNYRSDMDRMRSTYESTIDTIVSDADIKYNKLSKDLNDQLTLQQSNFKTQYAAQQKSFNDQLGIQKGLFDELKVQFDTVTDQYNTQVKKASNLANASVPAPVQSADVPLTGDAREEQQGGRLRRNNTLSNLTLLSGLGTSGSPNSGLQLA